MSRIPVHSSNIRSVGYDADAEVLEVEFHNDTIYHYFAVPAARFVGLIDARSKGGYLDRNIRWSYLYRQIR